MTNTADVKYVFLDVVGFTKNRSVEAQSEVVDRLNNVVRQALAILSSHRDKIILLPTGDGVAIALIDLPVFDAHLALAVQILSGVSEANETAPDEMRKFAVRIGINENVDNLIVDVNGQRNVAGNGISMAQRIMDQADGGQILAGQAVYERLSPREKYMRAFKRFEASDKHGQTFSVYQYVAKDIPPLNTATPSPFVRKVPTKPRLSKFAAYYMAHAIANREFLLSKRDDSMRDYVGIQLLYFLATDSVASAEASVHDPPSIKTWKAASATFEEQYTHYREAEFWTVCEMADLIAECHFNGYAEYFEDYDYGLLGPLFVTEEGAAKLKAEWPAIAREFKLLD